MFDELEKNGKKVETACFKISTFAWDNWLNILMKIVGALPEFRTVDLPGHVIVVQNW